VDATTARYVALREHGMGVLVTGKLGLLVSFNLHTKQNIDKI